MTYQNEGPAMQPIFTRGFRLHLADGHVCDGAAFPSGRTFVIDDPEYGLATVATSLEELLKGYHGARVEWTPPADRAAVLRWAADTAYRIARRLDDQHHDERAQGAWDVENALRAELRRVADEAQPTTGPGCWCGHPKSQHWSGAHKYGQELPWLPEGDEAATDTQDAPPVEPHPTEADLRHAMAVLDRFYGRGANEPAAGARQDGAEQ